jgi:nucleotidyltransferase substrate binding protein (TIGR01987 family)
VHHQNQTEAPEDFLAKSSEQLAIALANLKTALNSMETVKHIAKASNMPFDRLYTAYRDSLIFRFKYTFDLCWKYAAEYLESGGKKLDPKDPKTVFRECLKANVLSEAETRLALTMVDYRTVITHCYDEPLIEEVSQRIPAYFDLMEHLSLSTKIK